MKLGLGTAQLGMDYGIANRTGKPRAQAAAALLEAAVGGGMDCLDTAGTYGDSEETIGRFIKERTPRIRISSKFSDCRSAEKELYASLGRLGVDRLDYFLLHKPEQVFTENFGPALAVLGGTGAAGKIGVSVYTARELEECLKYDIQVLQIPFNILDARLISNDTLKRVKERGIELHARSIYLQGLLLTDAASLPGAAEYISKLDVLAGELSIDRKALCYACVRDNAYIDRFFVGCETAEQVTENLRLNGLPPLPDWAAARVEDMFSDVPERILNPALWERD